MAFHCNASSGNQERVGLGGLGMFIFSKLQYLVQDTGRIGVNLAQWSRLIGLPEGDLVVVNVYAPNTARERVMLWHAMTNNLPPNCRYLLCGDWNVVKLSRNKFSKTNHILSRAELFGFEILKAHLQVEDFFRFNQDIVYTWDNRREGQDRVLAQLDRVYSFASRTGKNDSHIKRYQILGDSTLSDHLPIAYELELAQEKPSSARYKFNSAYLSQPEVVAELTQRWKACPPTMGFHGKLRRVVKWYRHWCKNQARARKERESFLYHQLTWHHELLRRDPLNIEIQQALTNTLEELKSFESWRAEGQRVCSRVNWHQHGDRYSVEFFKAEQPCASQTSIMELMSSTGRSCSSQD
jgi:exonuclease III